MLIPPLQYAEAKIEQINSIEKKTRGDKGGTNHKKLKNKQLLLSNKTLKKHFLTSHRIQPRATAAVFCMNNKEN
ncbi:hypothetical protein DCO56_00405 [Sphingobacterium athyrii]|uniref:Uncharacterized protein n=1 Tax=Sphingobacterium athyrii TaxID=2152717 RepID=A0A363NXF0_9SPHI|nr:hypothetical protein DCO56_00405 [Sphingobacterium athyrii]